METTDTGLWESLETWMPHLFILAGVFSLVAGANYGVTSLFDSVSFNSGIGLTVLLSRVASLLGVAGLSALIRKRNSRLGKLSRGVVVLALLFTIALLSSAILQIFGTDVQFAAVLGMGTVILSLITYSLFGIGILHTDAYAKLVGVMLLGATVALLFGLFGRAVLALGVVGTIAEFALVVTHIAIGYSLLSERAPVDQTELSPETAVE